MTEYNDPPPWGQGLTSDEIDVEVDRRASAVLGEELLKRLADETAARGSWPNPRDANQPDPPWPGRDDVMLRYLLATAAERLNAGMAPKTVLTHLAVHAWFEGGIQGYDRGKREI